MNEKYYIWLLKCMGAGNKHSNTALEAYNYDIKKLYKDCKEKTLKDNTGITKSEFKKLYETDISVADEVLEAYSRFRPKIVTLEDEDYPKGLRDIFNPPILLFVVGDISEVNSEMLITVVGTRRESMYGRRACELICSEIASVGFSIVSGLANGGDTTAHITALKCGAKTYGFLACGLDVNYPYGKSGLKNVIIKHGAVITEFLPGTPPEPNNFHIRNRLMSGMSLGTLVVEAPKKSGTMITAHCAVEQGRDVFAVPSSIFFFNGRGVNQLIKEGAKPVKDGLDIIEEYIIAYPERIDSKFKRIDYIEKAKLNKKEEESLDNKSKIKAKKEAQKELSKMAKSVMKSPVLSFEEAVGDNEILKNDEIAKRVYNYLKLTPYTDNELAIMMNIPLQKLLTSVTKLEMAGIVSKDTNRKITIIKTSK